ncbi:hypothetical protein [Nostoc sp.]|uniref:hypothetical protein n=1 Tax=Nostoc sp. TaxID=1180 RepID=UPI002FF84B2D
MLWLGDTFSNPSSVPTFKTLYSLDAAIAQLSVVEGVAIAIVVHYNKIQQLMSRT